MKTRLFKNLILLLCLQTLPALASDGDIQKEKTISKAYLVNSDAGIDIRNKYGTVYVTTWDEDKIALDIVIKVTGSNEKKVMKQIDAIDVDITALKSLVTAITKIGTSSGSNLQVSINYTVKLPRKGDVKIHNQYGNIVIARLQQGCDIILEYGSMTATSLEGSTKLNLSYSSNCVLGYVKSATVNVEYSGLKIDKAGLLSINSDYSQVTIKDVDTVSYRGDYGGFNIGSAGLVAGNGDYLDQKFGNIEKSINLKGDYNNITISNVLPTAKNISISGDYDTVNITHDADYTFNFDYTLEYAGFKSGPDMNMSTKKESSSNSYYKGFYKKSSSNSMVVKLSYGSLKVQRK